MKNKERSVKDNMVTDETKYATSGQGMTWKEQKDFRKMNLMGTDVKVRGEKIGSGSISGYIPFPTESTEPLVMDSPEADIVGISEDGFSEMLHSTVEETQEAGYNNGGSTDYYKMKPAWIDCQDVIEDREMNYGQGNIFKVAFCFNQGRHTATSYERELNKIIWFAQRELDRIVNT